MTPFKIWPSAISPTAVADIGREVERAFLFADEGMFPEHAAAIVRAQDGIALSQANADACPHVKAAREMLLCQVFAGMADYPSIVGKVPMLHLSSMRRQRPDGGKALPWHQDAAALSTDDEDDAVVLWIPLHRIDEKTPSLEFIDGHWGVLPHTGSANGFASLSFVIPSMQVVAVPPLWLGDVLSVPIDAIHRTTIPPHAVRTRFSIDLRIGTPEFAAANRERELCDAG